MTLQYTAEVGKQRRPDRRNRYPDGEPSSGASYVASNWMACENDDGVVSLSGGQQCRHR